MKHKINILKLLRIILAGIVLAAFAGHLAKAVRIPGIFPRNRYRSFAYSSPDTLSGACVLLHSLPVGNIARYHESFPFPPPLPVHRLEKVYPCAVFLVRDRVGCRRIHAAAGSAFALLQFFQHVQCLGRSCRGTARLRCKDYRLGGICDSVSVRPVERAYFLQHALSGRGGIGFLFQTCPL